MNPGFGVTPPRVFLKNGNFLAGFQGMQRETNHLVGNAKSKDMKGATEQLGGPFTSSLTMGTNREWQNTSPTSRPDVTFNEE